jgi:hypothetical protein
MTIIVIIIIIITRIRFLDFQRESLKIPVFN